MKKLKSDFSLLRDKNAAKHDGYKQFVEAMAGRQYGAEALNDAWVWFQAGWDRAMLYGDHMCPGCGQAKGTACRCA